MPSFEVQQGEVQVFRKCYEIAEDELYATLVALKTCSVDLFEIALAYLMQEERGFYYPVLSVLPADGSTHVYLAARREYTSGTAYLETRLGIHNLSWWSEYLEILDGAPRSTERVNTFSFGLWGSEFFEGLLTINLIGADGTRRTIKTFVNRPTILRRFSGESRYVTIDTTKVIMTFDPTSFRREEGEWVIEAEWFPDVPSVRSSLRTPPASFIPEHYELGDIEVVDQPVKRCRRA